MSQRAHDGPVYPSRFSIDDRHPSSQPPADSLPQSALPSVSHASTTSSLNHDSFDPSRIHPLQTSLISPSSDSISPPGSFPIYGPTANAYFSSSNTNTTQSPFAARDTSTSYPYSTNALHDSIYTSAPPTRQLPDLRPMHDISNGHLNKSLTFADRREMPMSAFSVKAEEMPIQDVQVEREQVPMSNGSMKLGHMPMQDFQMKREQMPLPDGQMPLPKGQMPLPNGQIPLPKGQLPLPTGPIKLEEGLQPIHVVGSQGRRGILPSAAGRPRALPINHAIGQKGSHNVEKGADGKFSCLHCPKSYLHGKHLKRHMLRHTGDRPYTCGLCKDTFSRSDILKRHFQKCSQRRGNPTGQSHLSHSRANKKIKTSEEESIAAGINSMTPEQIAQMTASYPPSTLDSSIGMHALDFDQPNYAERPPSIARHMSRSNSMKRKKLSIRTPHSARGSLGSAYESSAYSTGHVTPDSITTSGAATPYTTYQHEPRSNQLSPEAHFNHSFGLNGVSRGPTSSHYQVNSLPHIVGHLNGRGQETDWNNYPLYTSHDDFNNVQHPSGTSTPQQIKNEPDGQTDWPWTPYLNGKP